MKKESNNYINVDELKQEIEHYNISDDKPSDRLGQMILDMVDHIISSSKFNRYPQTVKDDMKSKAIFFCVRGLKNITSDRNGRQMFNYLTTAIFTAFLQVIKKYHREVEMKDRIIKSFFLDAQNINIYKEDDI